MTQEKRIHRLDELRFKCTKSSESATTPPVKSQFPELINLVNTVIGMHLKMSQSAPIIRNTNPNGLIISDVRSQVAVSPNHEEEVTTGGGSNSRGMITESPSSNNSRISNLLRPIYMQVENVRDTESDGAIYNFSTVNSFQCDVCSKSFTRKSNMVRHRHNQHNNKARSRVSLSVRTAVEDLRRFLYKCKTCQEEFSERRTLNKHKMSHRKTFSCSVCRKDFFVKREMDWHEAECNGRINASRKSRKGRLQSSVSVCEEVQDKEAPDSIFLQDSLRQFTKTPTLTEKFRSIQKWCNSTSVEDPVIPETVENASTCDDDTRSTISRFTSVSQKTTGTCISSRSSNKTSFSRSIYTDYSYRSALTIQSFKNEMLILQSRRVTRSVTSRMRKIDLELKVRQLMHKNTTKSTVGTRRHFDITRRRTLRTNKRTLLPESLECGCNFTGKNLRDFMEHEISVHKKLPLFRCRQCGDCYTQKHFLEQHEECHRRICSCVWCFTQFDNVLDLKNHLDLHSLNNAFKCGFCEAIFISRQELRDHVKDIHSDEDQLKIRRKAEILIRKGRRKEVTEKTPKEYRMKELIQPAKRLERRTWILDFYLRFKRVKLGSLNVRDKDTFREETEPILLPVSEDICRYSASSLQISESHGSTKVTVTPPPSLRELGVFDTPFPVSNGTYDYPASSVKSQDRTSATSSPTNRKSQITLPERISRQTVSQPKMPLNGTDKILPAYESWPMHRLYFPVQPGAFSLPYRMT